MGFFWFRRGAAASGRGVAGAPRRACLLLGLLALPLVVWGGPSGIVLGEWERGVVLRPRDAGQMAMYLWFYEWNLFDALSPGEHSRGTFDMQRRLTADGQRAVLSSPMLELTVTARDDGAELVLRATNLSGHDWPEIAAIVPCFNPGRRVKASGKWVPLSPQLTDTEEQHTYFLSRAGLLPLVTRAIHFDEHLWPRVAARATAGQFSFKDKWPSSPVHADGGLIVRESADGAWVTAIAWDDSLSVQGHNPWHCMHASVRVGPLKRGESKTVRGRVYLFKGKKEDVLRRHRAERAVLADR